MLVSNLSSGGAGDAESAARPCGCGSQARPRRQCRKGRKGAALAAAFCGLRETPRFRPKGRSALARIQLAPAPPSAEEQGPRTDRSRRLAAGSTAARAIGELQGRRRVASRVLHSCCRCRGALRPVFVNTTVTREAASRPRRLCGTDVAAVPSLVRPQGDRRTIAVAATFRPCASSTRSAPNRRRCLPRGRSRPWRGRRGTSSRRSPGTTSPSTAPTRRHCQ
jgi:hypothetical protein